MSGWPNMPQQDDYGFSNSYGQSSASQQSSRSTQQSYPTAYTPAQTPFYRLQATAAAAADYSGEVYQSQAYGQRQPQQQQQQPQRPANESLNYSNQWYGGNDSRTTASTGNDSLQNPATMNQAAASNNSSTTAGGHGNRVYDTTGFENLVYASAAVGYATETRTEQPRTQEVSNTGNHYGSRTLPAASDTQAQYNQTYPQPATTTANPPQYNAYVPQIARPASTDSSASHSTSSQRQTPVLPQQNLQNTRPNAARTNSPYAQQQTSGHGLQAAKQAPTQKVNAYAPRQAPVSAPRVNQTSDRIAQAARAYAQQQAFYNKGQSATPTPANSATSFSQRPNAATPSQRQASNLPNQRQVPPTSSQRQTATTSHQRVPSANSNPSQPSPTFPQRQVSTPTSAESSPLYRTTNLQTQPGQASKSNLSQQQSPNYNQQQSQASTHQVNQNNSHLNTPQASMNRQPPQQSLSASNQSRNPRSLLSPTVASAQAYQSRTAAGNRQEETREPQMQTLIDPRDLDLRPRPSPSAILEAAKMLREEEERQTAVKAAEAAAKEQAQLIAAAASAAQEANVKGNPSTVHHTSVNEKSRNGPQASNGSLPGSARSPAAPPISIPRPTISRPTAASGSSQPAASPQVPNKSRTNNDKPTPSKEPQVSAPKRNRVVWPEDKKASLATAAIIVLKSFPENSDKTITEEQIHAMLDKHPSYIEFCEMIEGMKFRIDRAELAKTMLSAAGESKQNSKQHPANSKSSRQGHPPIDPQILGQNQGRGAVVSMAEPSVGPDGQSQIQWRPLSNNGPGDASVNGEVVVVKKKRPHRKSAPELGPDGQPLPRRPRGRPRRDGLPPIPRKSMPAIQSAANSMASPSTTDAHQLSAFTYQPSSSMQGPPRLNIDQPRSPLVHESGAPEPAPDDWRARHAKALKDRWDSMDDKPKNFPYPNTPVPDDVENRLLAALGDNGQNTSGIENRLYANNIPQNQGNRGDPTRDFHFGSIDGQASSAAVPAPSSSNKRNATGKAGAGLSSSNSTIHAQTSGSQQQQQEKPLTKEMAARKRNFSELIDLTKDASDDDAPGPQKFRRVDNATRAFNENHYGDRQDPGAKFTESHGHGHPLQPVSYPRAEQFIAPGFNRQQHDLVGSSSPQISSRSSPNPYEQFDDLCKPIEKKLALRKSEYDPKTIARDVLITINRHPEERGLNSHLDILKKKFPKQITKDSDLSTFRWDIVDPGGLPVGSANMPLNEDIKSQKAQDKNPDHNPYASQDKNSGTLSAFERYKTPYGPRPETPLFKRPVITTPAIPSQLRYEASGASGNSNPAKPSQLRQEASGPSGIASPVNNTPARSNQLRREPNGSSGIASPSPRRGRPPKDRSGESNKAPSSVGEGSTSNATPKKRGRPFKSEESAAKAALKQKRLSTGELQPGRRGRPPKAPRERTNVADPKYISFDCEWRDCKAELQNLETLRQHIFTVHNKPQHSGGISCKWINCGKEETVTDLETDETRTVHRDLILPDIEKFKKHIEKHHMEAYKWKLGDGPKGSDLDGNESDVSYLSDANGKQVTPSIADQEVVAAHRHRSNSLTITVNKNGEPRKRVGRPPKTATALKRAQENMDKLNEKPGSENVVDDAASRDSSVAAGSA